MAKWYSALFSDIRNKLGDQVVFGTTKGRNWFRAWVIPTNPNTAAQQAVRARLAAIVALWQANVTTAAMTQVWDTVAAPLMISGYNLFTKEGIKSDVAAVAGGSAGEVDVTYTIGLSSAYAKMYVYDETATAWTDETPGGGLEEGVGKTVTLAGLTTGNTVSVYIADSRPLVSGDSAPQDYQAVSNIEIDKTAGTAVANSVVVP